MSRFPAHPAAAVVGLLLALGCAGMPSPRAEGDAPAQVVPTASGVDLPPLERQVMVTLPPGSERQWERVMRDLASRYALTPLYQWTMESLGEPCIVFAIPENRSAADLVTRLAADRRVALAQPVQRFRVLADAYNDPYAHLQHAVTSLRLPAAQRMATGKGVRVALVDTGIDFSHPDLAGRVVKASNYVVAQEQVFTSDVHGTAVAGIIAATAGNGEGIVGVAPGAELLALKACWQEPPAARQAVCNSYTLAQAVDDAVRERAQVLNFSLAGPPDPLLGRLIGAGLEQGMVVVAAAEEGSGPGFPASLEGVIAVAATDLKGNLRATPRPGEHRPLLAAPGVDVLSTVPRGAYDFFSGSSLAAAQVSGIAALLLERRPELTAGEIARLLAETARPAGPQLENPGPTGRLVDACAALARALGGGDCG